MKTLCLLRHAKSSWKYPELDDFERPLNLRGRKDAPLMGKILIDLKFSPDIIISSPASRAAFTARLIAKVIQLPEDKVVYHNLLYETDPSTLMKVIHETSNMINGLLLIGHNPGFTSLANLLADHYISNIPTCGIYGMRLNISSWSEVTENCAKFLFFEYPKKHISKK